MSRMIFFISFAVLAMFLTGCAHFKSRAERQHDWEALLDNSKGRDINDMIAHVGPPTKTYAMPNGDTMYTWATESRRYVSSTSASPNFYPRNARFRSPTSVDTDTDEIVSSCEETFITGKDQKVKSWVYKGNSCY